MRIGDVMTRDVRAITPDRSVRDAARFMDELNVGVLPVCEGERLVGLITDRDITVRSTAAGIAPDQQRVAEVMTADPRACREDDDARDVLRRMSEAQVRRMPVVDGEGCLIGIVSLGDLATEQAAGADEALRCISTPSEPDRSGTLTTARADAARNAPPGRLSEDEQRELDRRLREPDPGRPDEGRAPGSGVAETGGQGRGFALGDEDHVRAAFGLSRSPAQGGDQEMRGGYGGEGYRHYGASYSSGALGGGAGSPAYFGGHGSRPDGTPRQYGSEGEENYDRGVQSNRHRRDDRESSEDAAPQADPGARAGHVTFGDPTAGLAHDGDGGRPAGTEPPVDDTGITGGAAGTTAGSPSGGRQT